MIEFASGSAGVAANLGYGVARDTLLDPRGRTVRCTPRRRTVMQDGEAGGPRIFRKLRRGGVAAARREWRWLGRLPELGFATATPVCLAVAGSESAVVTLAVPGRPLSALLREASAAVALEYSAVVVAPMVARLHGHGLVFRDLYWNHLFAAGLDLAGQPAFIDVERVLAPRWRWRRWVVKDLAGLSATWPQAAERLRVAEALTRAYLAAAGPAGVRLGSAARLTAAVVAKACRVASRRPRYGA